MRKIQVATHLEHEDIEKVDRLARVMGLKRAAVMRNLILFILPKFEYGEHILEERLGTGEVVNYSACIECGQETEFTGGKRHCHNPDCLIAWFKRDQTGAVYDVRYCAEPKNRARRSKAVEAVV